MKSLQLAAANLALSLLCISQAVYAQDNTGLKAYTAKGCYSSSSPLEDQGPYLYQTPGYCQKTCVNLNKPVMGLIAGSNCWCGDLVPAANSKVSDSECNTNCQGFPADKCGGSNSWSVYLTGTDNSVGNVQSSSSQTGSDSGSDSDSNTNKNPKTAESSSASAVKSASPTAAAKSKPTAAAPPSADPDSTKNEPPSTITRASTVVVTAPGQTKAAPPAVETEKKSKGPNTAGIAAGVVVGVVAICAIAGGLFIFLRNRKRRAVEEAYHKSTSEVFGGEIKPPMSSSSMSDSRLEPSVMMQRRQSDGSIADNQDYSRRILKVTNPDGS